MDEDKSLDNFAERMITLTVGTQSYTLPAGHWDVLMSCREQKLNELATFNSENAKLQHEKNFCMHPYRQLDVYKQKISIEPVMVLATRNSQDKEAVVMEPCDNLHADALPFVMQYLHYHRGRYSGELHHPPRFDNLFSDFMRHGHYDPEMEKLRYEDAHFVNDVSAKGLRFLCQVMETAEKLALLPLCDLMAYRVAKLCRDHLEAPVGSPLPEAVARMPFDAELLFPDPHDAKAVEYWADRNPTFFGLPEKKDNDRQPLFGGKEGKVAEQKNDVPTPMDDDDAEEEEEEDETIDARTAAMIADHTNRGPDDDDDAEFVDLVAEINQ